MRFVPRSSAFGCQTVKNRSRTCRAQTEVPTSERTASVWTNHLQSL